MKHIFQIIFILTFFGTITFAQNLALVKDINTTAINNSYPHYLTVLNNKIYFVAGNGESHKLYVSNGSELGTELVGPTANLTGVVSNLTAYNSKLYFTYDDGVNGLELWVSDGTVAGTIMLKDIWAGALSSLPRYFTVCNGLLFFQASTAARSEGLWVTDGTASGTKSLGNVYAGPFNSTAQFLVFENKIYFQGNSGSGYGMWVSDGSIAGTQLVKSGYFGSSAGNYAVCNGKFYFAASDNVNGNELWVSDGTNPGTVLVKDINAGIQGSSPQEFICSNNKVYFNANDAITGTELWVSDGSEAGTKLVKDILMGGGSANPKALVNFNNVLYFFASNGSATELYKTNGTAAGTELIKTLTGIASVPVVYEFNSKLYFFASSVIGGGAATIFESDGTAPGTKQIMPLVSSYFNYSNESFLGFNSELYLPAFFGTQGVELCKLNFDSTSKFESISALNQFKLYPNPALHSISIDISMEHNSLNYNYFIYNSIGALVDCGVFDNLKKSNTINIEVLTKGHYVLKITDGVKSKSIKFVKLL